MPSNRALHEDVDTPQIVEEAIADFYDRYGTYPLPPIVVVIAAYNEEPSLPTTLAEIPDEIEGLAVRALVIDDGSTDASAKVADEAGALVCSLSRNCGQGTATRAGYQIVRERHGKYIATVDADGQWAPADLPPMVKLLEADQADLVLGSRQLGRTENYDAVRNFGVRLFARVISVLTGTKITDSSSGLRCMRAEITGRVRQTQPQYQAAEFVIGTLCQGYRVAEVPAVMRVRHAGETKKGRNAFYGMRYAEVIVTTWLRERRNRVRPRA